jgi:hypothetical protein
MQWYLDTIATNHICCSLSHFSTYKRIRPARIHLPNGYVLISNICGTIYFSSDFYLTDVLFIPDFNHNLISIIKLTSVLHCHLIFSNKVCWLQTSSTLRQIGIADDSSSLYLLSEIKPATHDDLVVPSFKSCNNVSVSSNIWHYRLGHAADDRLTVIHKQFPFISANKDIICDVCHFLLSKNVFPFL